MSLPHKLFRSSVFNPLRFLIENHQIKNHETLDKLDQEKTILVASKILSWAKAMNVTHYTFWIHPQTISPIEKHQAFLELDYLTDGIQKFKKLDKFTYKILKKGEGDGSSIPNGGIRSTNLARAYIAWDTRSDVFIRQGINKTLYIPAMLLTHHGQALDQKTFFRRAQQLLKKSTIKLLQKLGQTNVNEIMFNLGIQQQFFVLKKSDYNSRLDLKMTNRALYGNLPPRNQQFSQHYYGRVNNQIFEILNQAENELLKLGVPVKTKHKEVAINQYQISSFYEDALIACDHNILTMQILQQIFDKHGYVVIFQEKPFKTANGSGKHCNWSLSFNKNGVYENLFEPTKNPTTNTKCLLFILMTLKCVQQNAGLLKASVTSSGNQHRMGGHQAPPCIISAFLGDQLDKALNCIQNGKQFVPHVKDLSENIPGLQIFLQDNTDRNRTSPFAFTGNKFEFRAVGGKQNVSFPMTVIAAGLTKQIQSVTKQLQNGTNVNSIIRRLISQTKKIRFQGDGYSHQWQVEATKRRLSNIKSVQESFKEIVKSTLLTDLKIFSQRQIQAKYNILMYHYQQTKITQANSLILIINQIFIPRTVSYLGNIKVLIDQSRIFSAVFKQYEQKYKIMKEDVENLRKLIKQLTEESNQQKRNQIGYALRQKINEITKYLSELEAILPADKKYPQLYDILNNY